MKVKGTGSRCLLQECVKDKYYARFHLHSYHCCREMNFISRLNVNFLDSTQNIDKVSQCNCKVGLDFQCSVFNYVISWFIVHAKLFNLYVYCCYKLFI